MPSGSRSIRPSSGSAVAAVIPAIASAREFAHAPWPSRFWRKTGRSGTIRSRSSRRGVPPGKSAMYQPLPRIHGTSGWPAHRRRSSRGSPSAPRLSCRSQRRSERPPWMGWTWTSWKPGSTLRPRELHDPRARTDEAGHVGVGARRPRSGRPGPRPPRRSASRRPRCGRRLRGGRGRRRARSARRSSPGSAGAGCRARMPQVVTAGSVVPSAGHPDTAGAGRVPSGS